MHFLNFLNVGIFVVCVWACAYICLCLWKPEALDPHGVELQAVLICMMWMIGVEQYTLFTANLSFYSQSILTLNWKCK